MRLRQRVFTRGSWAESSRAAEILRKETVGGVLLVVAAVTALLWANSPWSSWYYRLGAITVGPERLHLNLTLAGWATDGLLAIFFFVVGVELKREFVAGDLRDPGRAALPIVAAVGGMLVPAAIYLAVNASGGGEAMRGWAIPTATDIAFALAVLAVISTHLPSALRTFLLTLAVVDDLLAVIVIAVFYTDELHWAPLGLALIPLALFGVAVQRRRREWWLLVPLALTTWALVHASGVHATVAGVLLGFTVPVLRRDGRTDVHGMAERFEHRMRPVSAGVAVPVFAFFAAGVTLGGFAGLWQALLDPVALGVVLGLLVGKPIGIFLTTYLLARFTRANLDDDLSWLDIAGVALLAGIGFTVSLLIGELAFGTGLAAEHVKVGVLAGSLTSAAVASVVLRLRNRAYRRIEAKETLDADHDGVPDVFGSAPSDRI
ncbi:Na+/H+ antiporter NhaA [Mycolicibacterium phlei]|uniref:Na+/H+ antiporter NhaA n=1 Tax=Mycobacteroides chelonae TaxID=1774 RepID=UPI000618D662|nr:Na+/H+ antiporter NhaA [Mycobacteroides chelonae]VEG17871.1 Na+/H+ antiporter NhaA [Mycolicibacterium phlei]AKC39478.1 Na(+)/H(+) antiporter NhaA [Mycobacteroides chelonae]ANA98949.1 Na(+)/H(+) antiporter NhaA [Mycobacteroides chelonae CCUG 47445]OLT72692.1 Na+/H+ antiporter NhaA [Mycobacteroides chelonae]ORV12018.1 sodium:proton antiporter [Mycobacteroides chelonae]